METENPGNGKPGEKNANGVDEKLRQKRIVDWVYRLARTFDVETDDKQVQDYVIALGRLAEATLHVTFRKAVESWPRVNVMPPIAILVNFAAKYHATVEQELASAARWGDEEAARILAELRAKAPASTVPDTISYEERKLFVAHEVVAMNERYQRDAAAPRLAPTAPTDPEARRQWAHQKAIEMGWLDDREVVHQAEPVAAGEFREPGSDDE